MSRSVLDQTLPVPRDYREKSPAMAKATIKVHPKGENETRLMFGRAIVRALRLIDWTAERLAKELERDHRQIGRWITGEERPQIESLWDIKELRQPLVIALAEMAHAEVETVIRVVVKR